MFLIYLCVGAAAGLCAGLFGLGGGVIVVPALAFVFSYFNVIPVKFLMHVAIATSLAAIILTSLSACYAHYRRGTLRWDLISVLLPGLLIGSLVGSSLAHYLPSEELSIGFSLFLFYISFKIFNNTNTVATTEQLPPRHVITITSFLIGTLTSILGAGGGSMLVPFLFKSHINVVEASATTVATGIFVGLIATLSYIVWGWSSIKLPHCMGYIYLPAFYAIALSSIVFAQLGTMLAYRCSTQLLKKMLGIFLIFIALDMLFLQR